METKTIRFEKGVIYGTAYLNCFFDSPPDSHFNYNWPLSGFECLKSFTVTITITEDGE